MDGWIFSEIKLECVQNVPEIKLECVQKVCRGGGVKNIEFGCYQRSGLTYWAGLCAWREEEVEEVKYKK